MNFMKALIAIVIAAGALAIVFDRVDTNPTANANRPQPIRKISGLIRDRLRTSPNPTGTPLPSSENPFGVMFPSVQLSIDTKIGMSDTLGVSYYRPAEVKVHTSSVNCADCTRLTTAGYKLVLTARNGGGAGNPSTPPSDYNLYRTNITKILDTYSPALLVVENEENSMALFYSGTPAQYHEQLRTACTIAHQKGFKCTNGGFVSSMTAALVLEDYYNAGKRSEAESYFQRTLAGRDGVPATYEQLRATSSFQTQVTRGQQLIAGYKAAGADYINFHWYVADTRALEETVSYLRRITGLQPITNELGQQNNESPTQVTSVMQKVKDLGLPIAVWFSHDVSGFAGARSLFNTDGSIRPNGQAFANFISANY